MESTTRRRKQRRRSVRNLRRSSASFAVSPTRVLSEEVVIGPVPSEDLAFYGSVWIAEEESTSQAETNGAAAIGYNLSHSASDLPSSHPCNTESEDRPGLDADDSGFLCDIPNTSLMWPDAGNDGPKCFTDSPELRFTDPSSKSPREGNCEVTRDSHSPLNTALFVKDTPQEESNISKSSSCGESGHFGDVDSDRDRHSSMSYEDGLSSTFEKSGYSPSTATFHSEVSPFCERAFLETPTKVLSLSSSDTQSPPPADATFTLTSPSNLSPPNISGDKDDTDSSSKLSECNENKKDQTPTSDSITQSVKRIDNLLQVTASGNTVTTNNDSVNASQERSTEKSFVSSVLGSSVSFVIQELGAKLRKMQLNMSSVQEPQESLGVLSSDSSTTNSSVTISSSNTKHNLKLSTGTSNESVECADVLSMKTTGCVLNESMNKGDSSHPLAAGEMNCKSKHRHSLSLRKSDGSDNWQVIRSCTEKAEALPSPVDSLETAKSGGSTEKSLAEDCKSYAINSDVKNYQDCSAQVFVNDKNGFAPVLSDSASEISSASDGLIIKKNSVANNEPVTLNVQPVATNESETFPVYDSKCSKNVQELVSADTNAQQTGTDGCDRVPESTGEYGNNVKKHLEVDLNAQSIGTDSYETVQVHISESGGNGEELSSISSNVEPIGTDGPNTVPVSANDVCSDSGKISPCLDFIAMEMDGLDLDIPESLPRASQKRRGNAKGKKKDNKAVRRSSRIFYMEEMPDEISNDGSSVPVSNCGELSSSRAEVKETKKQRRSSRFFCMEEMPNFDSDESQYTSVVPRHAGCEKATGSFLGDEENETKEERRASRIFSMDEMPEDEIPEDSYLTSVSCSNDRMKPSSFTSRSDDPDFTFDHNNVLCERGMSTSNKERNGSDNTNIKDREVDFITDDYDNLTMETQECAADSASKEDKEKHLKKKRRRSRNNFKPQNADEVPDTSKVLSEFDLNTENGLNSALEMLITDEETGKQKTSLLTKIIPQGFSADVVIPTTTNSSLSVDKENDTSVTSHENVEKTDKEEGEPDEKTVRRSNRARKSRKSWDWSLESQSEVQRRSTRNSKTLEEPGDESADQEMNVIETYSGSHVLTSIPSQDSSGDEGIQITPELECLYKNKNYVAPEQRRWETIKEIPTASDLFSKRRFFRYSTFEDSSIIKQTRRFKKAVALIKNKHLSTVEITDEECKQRLEKAWNFLED